MRRSVKRRTAGVTILLVVGLCAAAGCAPQQTTANVSDDAAPAVASEDDSSDWSTVYPLEYWSFANGGGDTEDLAVVGDRQGFSHATMAKYMFDDVKASDGSYRGVCMACKSPKFNELYEEYGDEVFSAEGSPAFAEAIEAGDYWDCTTCHSDMTNPAGSVGAQIQLFPRLGATLCDQLDPKTAACGQCHNNANRWMSGLMTSMDEADTYDPYRYGWDADSMMRAQLEDQGDKAKKVIDEESGVWVVNHGGHPDVEMFQGSVMQQAGLTCVDCHMPQDESVGGTTYTSHNASQSPTSSAAALATCIECHTNQGIETIDEMKEYVRSAQAEVAALDGQVVENLASLNEAIKTAKAAGATDETLDAARESYAQAAFYRDYVLGNNGSSPVNAGGRGTTPGEKVAHNPQMSREYLQRAIAVCEDASAALA